MLRYVCLLGYPDGVPVEEGERWYLGTHTQEAKHIPGLRRYVSWRAAPRPPDVGDQRPSRWDRVTELAFDGWDGWRDGAVARSPRYTPAPYGPRGFHSETVFIRGEPEYDLLAQTPRV